MTEARTRIRSVTLKDGAIQAMQMSDGLQNVISGLGGRLDQQTFASYFVREFSQQEVESSFRSSWVTRKGHTIPVDAMVRAGWAWKAAHTVISDI